MITPTLFLRPALAAAVLGVASIVHADDFEMLAQDTYLSPAMLNPGLPVKGKPQTMFLTGSLLGGIESCYQYRNESSKDPNYTAGAALSLYVRRFQIEATHTSRARLERSNSDTLSAVPVNRVKAAVSYYFPLVSSSNPSRTLDADDFRITAGWTRDRRRTGEHPDEFFIDVTARLVPVPETVATQLRPVFREANGGYLYAWNPDRREHFFGYSGRMLVHRFRKGMDLKYIGSLGATLRRDGWDVGAWQTSAVLSIPDLISRVTFDVGVSVVRDFQRGDWKAQVSFVAVGEAISKILR